MLLHNFICWCTIKTSYWDVGSVCVYLPYSLGDHCHVISWYGTGKTSRCNVLFGAPCRNRHIVCSGIRIRTSTRNISFPYHYSGAYSTTYLTTCDKYMYIASAAAVYFIVVRFYVVRYLTLGTFVVFEIAHWSGFCSYYSIVQTIPRQLYEVWCPVRVS